MTEGHEHWPVTVKRDGLVHRILTHPIFWADNIEQIDKSPYPYGPCPISHDCGYYYLSTLSVLHRWFGLTLWFPEEDENG